MCKSSVMISQYAGKTYYCEQVAPAIARGELPVSVLKESGVTTKALDSIPKISSVLTKFEIVRQLEAVYGQNQPGKTMAQVYQITHRNKAKQPQPVVLV